MLPVRWTIVWGTILAHYLAGIQYAMGDLKADAIPSGKIQPPLEPARGPKLGQ